MLTDRFSVVAKLTCHYSQFSAVVKKKASIIQFIGTTDGSLIVIENEALYCSDLKISLKVNLWQLMVHAVYSEYFVVVGRQDDSRHGTECRS